MDCICRCTCAVFWQEIKAGIFGGKIPNRNCSGMNPEQFLSHMGLWMIRADRLDGNLETMLPGRQERIIQKPLQHMYRTVFCFFGFFYLFLLLTYV